MSETQRTPQIQWRSLASLSAKIYGFEISALNSALISF